MSDVERVWSDKAIADYFNAIPMPSDYARQAYIATKLIKDGLRDEINALRAENAALREASEWQPVPSGEYGDIATVMNVDGHTIVELKAHDDFVDDFGNVSWLLPSGWSLVRRTVAAQEAS